MQKVEGSSPFIRLHESPAAAGPRRKGWDVGADLLPDFLPESADVTGARARMSDTRSRTILGTTTTGGSWETPCSHRMDASGQGIPPGLQRPGLVNDERIVIAAERSTSSPDSGCWHRR
jgi:hypothetical protein